MQKGRQIPGIADAFLRDLLPITTIPPKGVKTIAEVALFAGCGMEYLYPGTGLQMAQFLSGHGVEVHFPKDQSCCGTPVLARGDLTTANRIAEANVEAFAKFDTVVTGCAACGATLKAYGKHFQPFSGNRKTFEAFSEKVIDLNQYLIDFLFQSDLPLKARKVYEGKKVTWHDPCHLGRYQGIKDQPRQILRSIPHIQYVEMPDADRCCGMGGSFSIHHYGISRKIAQKKALAVQASGADLVVTACPGCIAQLNDALIRNRMPQRAVHIIDLFDVVQGVHDSAN